ncbi:MAG: hypothetical protein RR397_09285 [Odoribacter sp.]
MYATGSLLSGTGNTITGNNRLIVGDSNTSSVTRNLIIGTNNKTGGINAACIGETNSNNGRSSLAVGYMNTISAERTLAVGNNNKLYKSQSLGTGQNNTVNSQNSFLAGAEHNLSGNYSFAAGAKATVSKPYGFAFGQNNTVAGTSAGALGLSNTVNANYSYAIGNNLINSNVNSLTVGAYNKDDQGLLFSVGSGTKTVRKNMFEVGDSHIQLGKQCMIQYNGDDWADISLHNGDIWIGDGTRTDNPGILLNNKGGSGEVILTNWLNGCVSIKAAGAVHLINNSGLDNNYLTDFVVKAKNSYVFSNIFKIESPKTVISGDLQVNGNIISSSSVDVLNNEDNLRNELKQILQELSEGSSPDDVLKTLLKMKDTL